MGARTRRKDGPFRQIAIRRLVNFIVETLDEETQWLVFEPNDSDTRGEPERAVRGLLDRIWRQGMLDGARPEEAYSLSAGPAVNPPDSIAAGRLVCERAFRPPRSEASRVGTECVSTCRSRWSPDTSKNKTRTKPPHNIQQNKQK